MFSWIGYLLVSYLAADLLAGFWHWWEDRYAKEDWPVVGKLIAKPNQLHHDQPQAFLNQSYWSRNWTTIVPSVVVFALTFPHPGSLIFVFVSQANEIHACAHRKGKTPVWVNMLQATGLLQSPRHHAQHHIDPFESKYCVMSDWLNPILDHFGFWRKLEWFVALVLRVHPKAG